MKVSRSHTTPQFEKDFVDLPEKVRARAKKRIKLFEENCFHPILDTHKLKGVIKTFWSFSISADFRVIFRFLNRSEIIYYRIGPHRIYKELERIFK